MSRALPLAFGWSLRERRQADLFLADLLGQAAFGEGYDEQPAQVCGFFRPDNSARTAQQVRAAVVARTRAEWAAWHTGTVPRPECDVARFGRLLGYYLAANADFLPDTLAHMQATAAATGTAAINYGALLAVGAAVATVTSEVARIRGLLVTGAPGAGAGLNAPVAAAIRQALQGHDNVGAFRAWSAAFVTACVRGAAISEGLEAVTTPGRTHFGRNALLRASLSHATYTINARTREANGRAGYQAFRPDQRRPQRGDIIVQDRRDEIGPSQLTTLAGLPDGLPSHGDIVVEAPENAGFVVTIGGNVADGVRKRRYPLNSGGFLVKDSQQLYTQENDAGFLPPVPATTCQALGDHSTSRIFALLKLVEGCRAVPPSPTSASSREAEDTPVPPPVPAQTATAPLVQSSSRADFFRMPPVPGHYLAMAYCGHQWGRRPVIEWLVGISQEWHRRHPERPFGLGDISAPDGSNIGHLSHRQGIDVDVYLPRQDRIRELVRHGQSKRELVGTDGVRKPGLFRPTTWVHPFYSRASTLELIELFVETAGEAHIDLVIINDQEVVAAIRTRRRVRIGTDDVFNPGHRAHDDHFHVRFKLQ